jgi:hypothetical protein
MTELALSKPRRLKFQTLLEEASGLDEPFVHFQPPNGMQMEYPAITYTPDREATQFADNLPYRSAMGYTVTVIHPDPDNVIKDKVASLPYCAFNRHFAVDGLNHDVYTIYF